MTRISTRMLITQHVHLFGDNYDPKKNGNGTKEQVGAIDTSCQVMPIVQHAYANAK